MQNTQFKNNSIERYSFYEFDKSTYVVFDKKNEKEICICSSDENSCDGEERAKKIAFLLNSEATKP